MPAPICVVRVAVPAVVSWNDVSNCEPSLADVGLKTRSKALAENVTLDVTELLAAELALRRFPYTSRSSICNLTKLLVMPPTIPFPDATDSGACAIAWGTTETVNGLCLTCFTPPRMPIP
eukprot:3773834-Rhodomonas_salina.1